MLEMQVKTMMSDTLDEYWTSFNFGDLCCPAESLLSEDIWKKFELEPLCDLPGIDDLLRSLDTVVPDGFVGTSGFCGIIRNHDCMWAGTCASKEHPADEYKSHKSVIPAPALNPDKAPAVIMQQEQQPVAAGRSLLLKTVTNCKKMPPVAAAPAGVDPDSPPISDDEDNKAQTLTLKILNDAIDECEIDEDSDLCEYFEDGEDLVTDPAETTPPSDVTPPVNTAQTFFNLQSDHCYHKDKNTAMLRIGLGIETPSDSEEEIDVVSVGEKQTAFGLSKTCYALPTNPSNKDRQQLQRTMATAITSKHPVCNKALMMKRTNSGDVTPKRRGVKRTKKAYKISPSQSPYKRRAAHSNSSDSEPELEKRSLHNNMERQRRIDLRNAFEELRVLVPQVNGKDRAAKVVILREAAAYCDRLGDASETYVKKLNELRRQQEYLRAKVSQLRRSLAAKR